MTEGKSKKTEMITSAEAAKRLKRSPRYTLTLLKAGRIKGVSQLQNGAYVVRVKTGEVPECDPPLKKRHKP